MNRYKQPKTEWKTDAWEDKQIIQKAVKWSQTEGIVLLVGKPKDEIFPETFIYLFAPNMADITKPVEIILTKNRQYIFGWKCELEDMDGIIGTMTANEANIFCPIWSVATQKPQPMHNDPTPIVAKPFGMHL